MNIDKEGAALPTSQALIVISMHVSGEGLEVEHVYTCTFFH